MSVSGKKVLDRLERMKTNIQTPPERLEVLKEQYLNDPNTQYQSYSNSQQSIPKEVEEMLEVVKRENNELRAKLASLESTSKKHDEVITKHKSRLERMAEKDDLRLDTISQTMKDFSSQGTDKEGIQCTKLQKIVELVTNGKIKAKHVKALLDAEKWPTKRIGTCWQYVERKCHPLLESVKVEDTQGLIDAMQKIEEGSNSAASPINVANISNPNIFESTSPRTPSSTPQIRR
jgi:vacuolar-type H+-ATPase subunit I/STV1